MKNESTIAKARFVFCRAVVSSVALVAFAPAILAQQTPGAPQSPKEPITVAPLLNGRRMAVKGHVLAAQAQTTGPLAAKTALEGCSFELVLKKGQKAIEARMVGQVRKNTATECEADFDMGEPTQMFATPQSVGVSVHSVMNLPDALPSDIVIGRSTGTAPDAALFTGAGTVSPFTVTGQQQFSSGQMAGIVKDPVGIQMTYMSQYVGWLWTQPGTCVQASGFSKYITDFFYDGWFLYSDSPTQYANCNGTVMYDYALFENFAFCALYYPPPSLVPPTQVYYWPQQVQGWQDGTLYGNFSWIIGGAICSSLLTPSYQLVRLVN